MSKATFGNLMSDLTYVIMERFDVQQRAFCVRSFFELNHSYIAVRRRFRARYALHNINEAPSTNLIKSWVKKFEQRGSTENIRPPGRPPSARINENIDRVRDAVAQDPRRSVRKRASVLQLHRSTVFRILTNDLKLHPFKTQLVQELKETDYPIRLTFANLMLQRFDDFNKIFFSDESHFHLHGYVNKQNCRYWSQENPREKHQTPLHSPKVTVWAAISSRGIIGPYFFEDNNGQTQTVNSVRYAAMIREFFGPALHEIDGFNDEWWFQQDGATSHTSNTALEAVRELFPNKLISRRGDINWPPRSPDLAPNDYFLWGYLKSRVYNNAPANLIQLKNRIREEIEAITPELCTRVMENLRHRLEECQRRDGRHLDDIIFQT